MLVNASGSVATVEQAFGVTIDNYTLGNRTVYAPTTAPTVPDTLGSAILNISGLDDVAQFQHAALVQPGSPEIGSGPAGGYTPTELRTAYDANSLLNNGDTGAGQTTALFELDGYNPSDIATYRSTYNLGAGIYSNVLIDGATATPGSNAIEVELDMEVMSAIAPDATQKIYIAPNSIIGVNDAYNQIVTDDQAKVTSISWSSCESETGPAELSTLDNIFMEGAAQGQSFFAASGDSGAYCADNPTMLDVNSPADDPNVVGVGGTTLNLASDGTYSSETAWGIASEGEGGGGGISAQFTRPAYQTGTNLTNLNREVPDVSAVADPHTGYSFYCTVDAADCTNGWSIIGGTSGAAPLWAGFATDINQYLAGQGKPTLGSASASLYALYNTPQTYPAYHDITSGNNLYYPASTGYDMASGLGTPDVWNLTRDLASMTTGGNTGPTQLLKNGTFDDGATSWNESSYGVYEIVDSTRPHAGGDSAHLCGYALCNDNIYQTVTLPTNAKKIVLSYWVNISTQKTGHTCSDFFYTRLRTSNGATISTPQRLCNANVQGWTQYTFNVTSALSHYAGKSIEVSFSGTSNAGATSDFFVDDVTLNVTQP
jgi:kumamolisin